ncbi:MAG TPA: DUF1772 domain-containing protein [Acidobacteriaceae bacterium]|jgi:uncharacterized membrane protein|nr:DUF1772 domain-containing protein [Acidobacteriaceae bacterium]
MILNILTTLSLGLLIGTEFAVAAFINPILRRLDDRAQLTLIQPFAARLGAAMPFWYVLSFVLLLIETVLLRHTPQASLLITASAIWAFVIVFTLRFLVPINNRMIRPAPGTTPEQALREHDRWDLLHRFRVLALTAAMVAFLVATHA